MLTNLKLWLFNSRIKRRRKMLNKQGDSSSNSTLKIACLFDASNPIESKYARAFFVYLKRNKIEYRALAYIESLEDSIGFSCPVYSAKDISWIYIPESENVQSFIEFPADQLIVLNPNRQLHKNYILAVSAAKLKAGITCFDTFDVYYQFQLELENIHFGKENHYIILFNILNNIH